MVMTRSDLVARRAVKIGVAEGRRQSADTKLSTLEPARPLEVFQADIEGLPMQAGINGCVAVDAAGASRKRALGGIGAPNARAETGGPATGPSPAAPNRPEPSGPVGAARASHCIHPDIPRGGNAAAQLNRVKSERSTGRINSAAVYSEADVDVSAMAAGSLGDHAPVSIELGRNCGRSGTNDCGSDRQNDAAHTIASHGSPHFVKPLVLLSGRHAAG